jgi:iron complex transport system ATP-binding protein
MNLPLIMAKIGIEKADFWRGEAPPNEHEWSLRVDRLLLDGNAIYSILGDNMVGKSTLLRILSGREEFLILPPLNTEARLFGTSLLEEASGGVREHLAIRAKSLAFLAHDDAMFPELSIWDNVRIARGAGSHQNVVRANEIFQEILSTSPILKHRSQRELLGHLSSGGKALIKLARACCWSSDIILIDEVTAHLDSANCALFFSTLSSFVTKDATVVLVSHAGRDHQEAARLAADSGMTYRSVQIQRGADGRCFIAP